MYPLPPLSFGGASLVRPWLRLHTPLIEPDMQISRIRLSDKTSRLVRVRRHLQFLEHSSELIGCPISRSLTTSCVRLELRSLPSTGVTQLQRCRVGGGALDCSHASLRPPLKLDVQFSRIQLSRSRSSASGNGRYHPDQVDKPVLAVELA